MNANQFRLCIVFGLASGLLLFGVFGTIWTLCTGLGLGLIIPIALDVAFPVPKNKEVGQ